ncbi:MAG: tetratricopeptide repeat protein [Fidelibacterota bacterium]
MTEKLHTYLAILLIILSVPAFGQNIDKLQEEGRALLEAGELDSAEAKLKIVIEADNTYHESHFLLSQIYFARYDLDNSRKHLSKAIEADKTNQNYRDEFERINNIASAFSMAKRTFDNGDYYGAIEEFKKITEEHRSFAPKALYYMGVAASREEEITEAVGYLYQALELDPNYLEAEKYLDILATKKYKQANQLVLRGDHEEAKKLYNAVLELRPNYFRSYFQLGYVATKQGDFELAIVNYKKAIELEPNYSKGWYALGKSYKRVGDIDLALQALDTATEVDSLNYKAYNEKGNIYLSEYNLEEAEKEYNNAIQANPSYALAYENLGNLLLKKESYEDAVQTLKTATRLNDRSYRAWSMLAEANQAIEECFDAKDAAHEALEIKKNYAHALFYLGLAEKCLGNDTLAKKAFNKARKDRVWRKLAEIEIDKIDNPKKSD